MKRTFKKSLSIILAAAIILCSAPLTGLLDIELPEIGTLFTQKAEAATSGYYTYTVSGGEATITSVDKSISGDITIPSTLGGYPVTSIGDEAFLDCDNLTSITITGNVTIIYDNAFANCSSLINLTLLDGVESIGYGAFQFCSSLINIVIPNSVTRIGELAFGYTGYYNNKNNWENGVLYINNYLIDANISGSYKIKDGTTVITDFAFKFQEGLRDITIPNTVTSIGNYAFYGCSNLKNIIIPNSVTSIGNYVLSGCTNLTDVYYTGSENEWNEISIGFYNKDLTNATIHYGSVMDDDIDAIIDIYAKNKSVWYPKELYGGDRAEYGFFDFDGDGILELVVSCTGGTGGYTSNDYYKVNTANNTVYKLDETRIPGYEDGSRYLGFDWWLKKGESGVDGPVRFELMKDKKTNNLVYLATDIESIGRGSYCKYLGTIQMDDDENIISEFLFTEYYNSEDGTYKYYYFDNEDDVEITKSVYDAKYNSFISQYEILDMTSLMSDSLTAQMTSSKLKEELKRLYTAFSYGDNSSSNFDEGINVFSSSGSMSIAQGEKTRYAVCVYENGNRRNDVSSLAFINETPDIFTISSNNDIENGYCYITVRAKNCGVGFLQINDTLTGETARIIISVVNPNANSYTIHNVPKLGEHGEHTPNILYFNGMSIDDFRYEKRDDDSCLVRFNVFNTLPVYAIVTVFDANGNPVANRLIDKHEQYSENLYSGMVDEPIKLLKDLFAGDLTSYRQTTGYSSESNITVLIPSNGYIKITNNSTESGILEIINFFDAFIKFKSFISGGIDLAKWTDVSYECFTTVAEELLLKTKDKHIKSFKSGLFMDSVKKTTFTSDGLLDCANILSYCVEALDASITEIIENAMNNALKVGVNILEGWFTSFAGTAGVVLKGAFVYNTYFNLYEKLYYIGATSNVGAISIRNPNESSDMMTYDNVTVINPNGFDSETSLSTYMIVLDKDLPEDFKNNILNSDVIKNFCNNANISVDEFVENDDYYEFRDITLIKNDSAHQPDGEVVVCLPIPEKMKGESGFFSRIKVYRVEEDGKLTDMNAKYRGSDEMMTFTTDHFSLYLTIMEKDPDTEHKHSYTSSTTPATCTQGGFVAFTCECGDVIREMISPATGHTQGAWVESIQPSCDKDGEKIAHCTVCDVIVARNTIPATGHIPGEWIVVVEPTTETEGKFVKKCNICDVTVEEIYTVRLPKVSLTNATITKGTCAYAETITVVADQIDGKIFSHWNVTNATVEDIYDSETTMFIHIGDLTIIAEYDDCDCNCHKGGITAFFFRIILFFQTIFGTVTDCACGAKH